MQNIFRVWHGVQNHFARSTRLLHLYEALRKAFRVYYVCCIRDYYLYRCCIRYTTFFYSRASHPLSDSNIYANLVPSYLVIPFTAPFRSPLQSMCSQNSVNVLAKSINLTARHASGASFNALHPLALPPSHWLLHFPAAQITRPLAPPPPWPLCPPCASPAAFWPSEERSS